MRNNRFGRFSPWATYCLCLLIAALAGCGDYCLFCDGQGGGGGGGGQKRTAEAGDVILADQLAGSISIYEYPDVTRRSLVAGYDDVSGLAPYSSGAENTCDNPFSGLQDYQLALNVEIVETFTEKRDGNDRMSITVIPKGMSFPYGADEMEVDETSNDLLFFTVNTNQTLYVYDLTGTSIPPTIENPIPITNNAILGAGFFVSPTALAISVAGNTVTLFFINDKEGDSSIRRLSLNLSTWIPGSPRTIATMKESGRRLTDIAYYDQTDELFVSKRTAVGTGGTAGWVHVISDAKDRTSSVNLDSDAGFLFQPYELTGVTVAPTNSQESQASLLALRANELGQVEQYNIDLGGNPEDVFNFSTDFQFPEALAYDCTNERLLITNVPFNTDSVRTFFQAFPSQ